MATKLAKHIGLIFEKISRNVSVEDKVESLIRQDAERITKENSKRNKHTYY